jgi:hypothetical protein
LADFFLEFLIGTTQVVPVLLLDPFKAGRLFQRTAPAHHAPQYVEFALLAHDVRQRSFLYAGMPDEAIEAVNEGMIDREAFLDRRLSQLKFERHTGQARCTAHVRQRQTAQLVPAYRIEPASLPIESVAAPKSECTPGYTISSALEVMLPSTEMESSGKLRRTSWADSLRRFKDV